MEWCTIFLSNIKKVASGKYNGWKYLTLWCEIIPVKKFWDVSHGLLFLQKKMGINMKVVLFSIIAHCIWQKMMTGKCSIGCHFRHSFVTNMWLVHRKNTMCWWWGVSLLEAHIFYYFLRLYQAIVYELSCPRNDSLALS